MNCSTGSAPDEVLIDTGGLLSALFPDQHRHRECAEALEAAPSPLVLSPFVLAELDYLIGKLAGVDAQLALLDEVSRGVYELAAFSAYEVGLARRIADTYRDLRIGLADASVVVLSNRLSDRDVLTVDERHFRVLAGDHPLRLLPADA
ncbi:PIN domain-containing protein [Pseudonocardia sp.]|uniref:PIN domain-containing protein n=1 Tax=Pseudonocardia sp. TaxID=60912 RepID=UPI002613970F|nr:PIN domain-containing protein [Pseudonocardia sp.]